MKKLIYLLFAACSLCWQSCDDNDDLWDAVNDLKSRVQALETQVEALNGNIEALQRLYGGATITEIAEKDGVYTLTLSNGETVTLTQGSKADAVIPVIGIDDRGFWQVSYDNGKTWQPLDCKAAAEDGKTPTFRIDDNGYWEVSYDGTTFDKVKDPSGQPVSAIGDNSVTDKFFETVEVRDGMLCVKLVGSSEELLIPIDSGFYCRIVGVEGVQTFSYGDERNFTVEMKGVESVVLTVPEGWHAILSDPSADNRATLTVSAPGAGTRALADSSRDVAIEATSANGLSCVAKLRVECEGDKPQTPPTVTVAKSETVAATETSVTFDVQPSADANGWKYILLTADAAAPAAEEIYENGTPGTTLSLTQDGLAAGTEYRIYVVAYKELTPVLLSEVASDAATTAQEYIDPNDYYMAGVEIDGIRYSRETEGAAVLEVAADAESDTDITCLSTPSAIFVGKDESAAYGFVTSGSKAVVADMAVIGRYADRKSKIKLSTYWALRNAGGKLVFKNLEIDCTGVPTAYVFNLSDGSGTTGGLGALVFEDCDIAYSCSLASNNNNPMSFLTAYNGKENHLGNIVFRNCKIHYASDKMANGNPRSTYLINLQATGLANDGFESMVFENNIVYMTGAVDIANAVISAPTRDLSGMTLTFRNNTVVDMFGFGTGANNCAMFVFDKIGNFAVEGNLFYASSSAKYPTVMSVKTSFGTVTFPRDGQMSYSGGNANSKWKMFADASQKPAGATTLFNTKDAANPFSTIDPAAGTFVKESAYAQYGSTLE